MRELIIELIKNSKNWNDGAFEDSDPPILENLSNESLLEQYDWYICGLK